MLAVIVSPHGFTTALMSEASIVPGASHRRITPTACPGRVLGAASQVRSCFVQPSQLVIQLRVARPSPNRTCSFTSIRLSLYFELGDTSYLEVCPHGADRDIAYRGRVFSCCEQS